MFQTTRCVMNARVHAVEGSSPPSSVPTSPACNTTVSTAGRPSTPGQDVNSTSRQSKREPIAPALYHSGGARLQCFSFMLDPVKIFLSHAFQHSKILSSSPEPFRQLKQKNNRNTTILPILSLHHTQYSVLIDPPGGGTENLDGASQTSNEKKIIIN